MTNTTLAQLSLEQLKRAVAAREKIESLVEELNRITGSRLLLVKNRPVGMKGNLRAAAGAKVSAARRAPWARRRGRARGFSKSLRVAKGSSGVASRTKHPAPHGQLKEQIIRTLKAAGKSGATVKDLAAKT